MGRSWHDRNRLRRLLPDGPATQRFFASLEEHLAKFSPEELETMMKATRRIMREHRKQRGRDRAWLRAALSKALREPPA